MNTFIISGTIKKVFVYGIKHIQLFKYEVEVVKKEYDKTGKKPVDVNECYYVIQGTSKDLALQVGAKGHFIGTLDAKKVTSKKAVNVSDGLPFIYGAMDLHMSDFCRSNKELFTTIGENYKHWGKCDEVEKPEELDEEDFSEYLNA